MRTVFRGDDMAILELRGGTHLLLFRGDAETGPAPFDLMVEDLDATHDNLSGRGLAVSDITRGEIHDAFTLDGPRRPRHHRAEQPRRRRRLTVIA